MKTDWNNIKQQGDKSLWLTSHYQVGIRISRETIWTIRDQIMAKLDNQVWDAVGEPTRDQAWRGHRYQAWRRI